jgi:sulfate/thiosulfate transport system substrate-binding protein
MSQAILGSCFGRLWIAVIGLSLLGITLSGCAPSGNENVSRKILNVSYDPTRELFKDFNKEFIDHWKQEKNELIGVQMSHGGAGKQARAVIDGLEADLVTLALAYDIDMIAKKTDLLSTDWQEKLPNGSAPYTSTIVFLVRKGNPKKIKDWDDLIRDDVKVITPHPKTSGGARWNYLAAWGYVLKKELGDLKKLQDSKYADEVAAAQEKAKDYITKLYQHVPILDSGARGATMTFTKRDLGDVLLAWENEALLSLKDPRHEGQFEMVVPSISILAQPPVTLVEKTADKDGVRDICQAYLEYLYTPVGQKIAAKHHYRPFKTEGVPEEFLEQFPEVDRFTVDEVFGGWQKAQKDHFVNGAVFDKIYHPAE